MPKKFYGRPKGDISGAVGTILSLLFSSEYRRSLKGLPPIPKPEPSTNLTERLTVMVERLLFLFLLMIISCFFWVFLFVN